jgi:hypothetical protein
MASLAQLLRGGSFTPAPGGGFTFSMDLPKSKFKLDQPKIRRRVGEARARALREVGLVVRDRTKRQMSSRKPRSRPVRIKVGVRFGLDLVALVDRVPKPGVVTSWRTSRNPRGMLRSDIQSDYDTRTKTVVIGPSKFPRLNELHEKGGSAVRYFKPVPIRARGNRVLGVLTNTPPKTNFRRRGARIIEKPFRFTIRIKNRAYMGKGLAAARPRIPFEFQDTIRGP